MSIDPDLLHDFRALYLFGNLPKQNLIIVRARMDRCISRLVWDLGLDLDRSGFSISSHHYAAQFKIQIKRAVYRLSGLLARSGDRSAFNRPPDVE